MGVKVLVGGSGVLVGSGLGDIVLVGSKGVAVGVVVGVAAQAVESADEAPKAAISSMNFLRLMVIACSFS